MKIDLFHRMIIDATELRTTVQSVIFIIEYITKVTCLLHGRFIVFAALKHSKPCYQEGLGFMLSALNNLIANFSLICVVGDFADDVSSFRSWFFHTIKQFVALLEKSF